MPDKPIQVLLKRLPFVTYGIETCRSCLRSRRLDFFLLGGIQDLIPYIAVDRMIRVISIDVSNEITTPYLPETLDYLSYDALVFRPEVMQESLLRIQHPLVVVSD